MEQPELTQLINLMGAGDSAAHAEVLAQLYASMIELARGVRWRGGRPGQTQTLELVHEGILRIGKLRRTWNDRRHFLATFALAIQAVRVEAYRAETREMDAVVTIGEEALHLVSTEDGAEADVLELREALEILQGENPLAAQIVRLRFFAQATHSEIAADLGIPEIRSRRTWTLARRRLNQLLGRSSHEA